MTASRTALGILALVALLAPPLIAADGPDPKETFREGEVLRAAGKLEAALEKFTAASEADPDAGEYAQEAMYLRRVISIRKYIAANEPSEKWERMVGSLHIYFLRYGLTDLAVKLDRSAFARSRSVEIASLLSVALIEAGRDQEALDHIDTFNAPRKMPVNMVYRGIALARLGRREEARKALDISPMPEEPNPGDLFEHSRLLSLLGEGEKACALLASALEKTPARSLEPVRKLIRECPDFRSLAKSDAFAKALATESKVEEGGCSGGSGCGSCPSKGSCGK